MRIGILGGTGPAGTALAVRLASVGYDVVIGSRSAERASEVRDELVGKWPSHSLSIEPAENAGAAKADLVVVATPWDSAAPTAQAVATSLGGKIVVSMANALTRIGKEFHPLIPPRGSIAVQLQAVLPTSRVVAAFQHLPAKELGDLNEPIDSDVLLCADDREALGVVAGIVSRLPGCRALDAGSLSSAAAVEAFTAVLLQLNVRYRTRVVPKFLGIPEDA